MEGFLVLTGSQGVAIVSPLRKCGVPHGEVRMTRRATCLALTMSLLASSLAGCLHMPGMSVQPVVEKQTGVVIAESESPPKVISRGRVKGAGGAQAPNVLPKTQPVGDDTLPPHESYLLTSSGDPGNTANRRRMEHPEVLSANLSSLVPFEQSEEHETHQPMAPAEAKILPPPTEEPIVLALRDLLEDKPQDALEQLKHYDATNQEALICLTAAVARLTRKKLDQLTSHEIAALQDQVQKSLLGALRPRADLVIDKMCFCEWIKGYGVYKPLPDGYEFQARVGDRPGEAVQLYIGLRNLTSDPRGSSFETNLQSTMRIYDQAGKEMVFRDFHDHEAPVRTLSPLPDYCKSYGFYVPFMPPGKYTLTIEVRDITRPEAPRVASKSVEFRVASPTSAS
jgi:hypothetical protein